VMSIPVAPKDGSHGGEFLADWSHDARQRFRDFQSGLLKTPLRTLLKIGNRNL
jgi:hypothetical protein